MPRGSRPRSCPSMPGEGGALRGCRQQHEASIGTSARARALSCCNRICLASRVSPRRFRHSRRPCRLQTLPGCWQAPPSLSSRPRSARYTASASTRWPFSASTAPQGMARWLHPAPGFVVRQVVVEIDRTAQLRKGRFVLSLVESQLALHHLFGNHQNVRATVVEQHSGCQVRDLSRSENGSFRSRHRRCDGCLQVPRSARNASSPA